MDGWSSDWAPVLHTGDVGSIPTPSTSSEEGSDATDVSERGPGGSRGPVGAWGRSGCGPACPGSQPGVRGFESRRPYQFRGCVAQHGRRTRFGTEGSQVRILPRPPVNGRCSGGWFACSGFHPDVRGFDSRRRQFGEVVEGLSSLPWEQGTGVRVSPSPPDLWSRRCYSTRRSSR